jgi:hypothetical protein
MPNLSKKKFQCRATKEQGEVIAQVDPQPGTPAYPTVIFKFDQGVGTVEYSHAAFNQIFTVVVDKKPTLPTAPVADPQVPEQEVM